MSIADYFSFTDTPSLSPQAFVVRIPAGLTSTESLFQAVYEAAQLPGYFGFNWNALSDCLQDLHWLAPYEVVLLHDDLPKLPSEELRTYLAVLAESVASWLPGEEHSLKVIFPRAAQPQVVDVK